ncbi:MAG: gfo/Idh/MocA family oxidoreductase, partial [Planctomycetes bacterium]|nr:gfo/Idh/MocA family oxidoreductase [Planctomycetota bacterium]
MSANGKGGTSRREFLGMTGRMAAAASLAGMPLSGLYAGEDNTLRLALIGCGGRGTGAVANALRVRQGPMKLVAMADVFEDRLQGSLNRLKKGFAKQVDVPKDRQFIGFDGYRKAMDCLRPGDIAIFTTPLAFRW